eukprot:COSAG04_NODE_17364_length_471_cov_0.962366_1_plen_75_part_00
MDAVLKNIYILYDEVSEYGKESQCAAKTSPRFSRPDQAMAMAMLAAQGLLGLEGMGLSQFSPPEAHGTLRTQIE